MSWWWLSHFRPRARKEARAVEEFLEKEGGRAQDSKVPGQEKGPEGPFS